MSSFRIVGGRQLKGKISVGGFKNAVLPLMAATLLTDEPCTITNVPDIVDVRNFLSILSGLGAKVEYDGESVKVECSGVVNPRPEEKLAGSMRASVVLLGALLGRLGRAELAYPGGDIIGARPIDVHARAFRLMGAEVETGNVIIARAKRLVGCEVFAESSVTGTENIILAAVKASGITTVKLAAQEPHVVSLCEFLNSMGARITGVGTHTLTIEGVERLGGAKAKVIPDMLEAGTFAVLACATHSEITVAGVRHDHLDAVYNKLSEMGAVFDRKGNDLILHGRQSHLRSATVRTGLYPNLATDLQPPFGVLATQCEGTSIIHDWIFEGRLGYLKELSKMGARVEILDDHKARVTGPTPLAGSRIQSLDIRSGMTLVIAALVADGETVIDGIQHIDRGYQHIDARLRSLGADIERVE